MRGVCELGCDTCGESRRSRNSGRCTTSGADRHQSLFRRLGAQVTCTDQAKIIPVLEAVACIALMLGYDITSDYRTSFTLSWRPRSNSWRIEASSRQESLKELDRRNDFRDLLSATRIVVSN